MWYSLYFQTHDSNPHLQEPLEGPNNLYFSNTDDPCLVEKPPIAEQLDLSTEVRLGNSVT